MSEITDLTVSLPLLLASWLGINVLAYVLAKVLRPKLDLMLDRAQSENPGDYGKASLIALVPLLGTSLLVAGLIWQ